MLCTVLKLLNVWECDVNLNMARMSVQEASFMIVVCKDCTLLTML